MDDYEVGAAVALMMSKVLGEDGPTPEILVSTETGTIQIISPISKAKMTYRDLPFCCIPHCWKEIEQQSAGEISRLFGGKISITDILRLRP